MFLTLEKFVFMVINLKQENLIVMKIRSP